MPISATLTTRAIVDLSTRSASGPGGAGEEKERRDEQGAGEHHERGRAEARLLGETERHDDAECALEQVVVERAQELRDEERREATRGQQLHEWRTHDNGS